MQVLVIGGTRFIGLHTVRRLVGRLCDVTVFHRGTTESDDLPDVTHIHGDRKELGPHREIFARLAPDVVLDMVPISEADATGVVAAFDGIAGRVVAISSQDVYQAYDIVRGRVKGPLQPVPLAEDAPLRVARYPYRQDVAEDHPLYDYDKILVEDVYRQTSGLPATILRLPCVYGPHDQQHRTHAHLRRMLDERPMILLSATVAGWRWTRAYVEDVAEAIATAVVDERAAGRTYNVGERRASTEREWVERIARPAGWGGDIMVIPDDEMPAHLRDEGNYTQDLVVDTTAIRVELGYAEIVDPDVAMASTVEWERANQPDGAGISPADYAAEDAAAQLRRDGG